MKNSRKKSDCERRKRLLAEWAGRRECDAKRGPVQFRFNHRVSRERGFESLEVENWRRAYWTWRYKRRKTQT